MRHAAAAILPKPIAVRPSNIGNIGKTPCERRHTAQTRKIRVDYRTRPRN